MYASRGHDNVSNEVWGNMGSVYGKQDSVGSSSSSNWFWGGDNKGGGGTGGFWG